MQIQWVVFTNRNAIQNVHCQRKAYKNSYGGNNNQVDFESEGFASMSAKIWRFWNIDYGLTTYITLGSLSGFSEAHFRQKKVSVEKLGIKEMLNILFKEQIGCTRIPFL